MPSDTLLTHALEALALSALSTGSKEWGLPTVLGSALLFLSPPQYCQCFYGCVWNIEWIWDM